MFVCLCMYFVCRQVCTKVYIFRALCVCVWVFVHMCVCLCSCMCAFLPVHVSFCVCVCARDSLSLPHHNYSFQASAAWGNLDVRASQTLSIPTGVSLGSAAQSKLSRAACRIDVQ